MTRLFPLLLCCFVFLATGHPAAQAAEIRLGQVGLSFYAVTGGVVQTLLEKEGHEVRVTTGSHAEIFPLIGSGKVDLLAATWLPNGHAKLYAAVEKTTFQAASLYTDARFFWVVPAYVPPEEISSVGDLQKAVAQRRMPKTIVSLPESTGVTIGGRRLMKAYGLSEAGYRFAASSPAEWLQTFKTAYAAKRWVVLPLWQPHWINAAYEVRELVEPKGAYGPPDTAYLLGHRSLRSKIPKASLDRLARVKLSVNAITEMDRMVNVEG